MQHYLEVEKVDSVLQPYEGTTGQLVAKKKPQLEDMGRV